MPNLRQYIDELAAAQRWTYRATRESVAESAAWSAIALAAHAEANAALAPAQWLAKLQQRDGSVGISAAEAEPRWPTALAMLAWSVVDRAGQSPQFQDHIERAARWSLADRGKTSPRSSEIGHDPSLQGWSWAANTASWLEPTCYEVLGLTAAGYGDHPRVIEGRRVIVDRLLPDGGANYGNTIVLGQQLLPHVAPSGVALVALATNAPPDDRIEKSLAYIERAIGPDLPPASLSWACLGLTAHDRLPGDAEPWIEAAFLDTKWQPLAAYEHALMLLAAAPTFQWLPGSVKAVRS
jgi:hypothetical protein